jgi:hypothetical protein
VDASGGLACTRGVEVGDDDFLTRGRERSRNRAADSAGAAGDEGGARLSGRTSPR